MVTVLKGMTSLQIYCLASCRLAENQSVSIYKFLQNYLTEYEFDYRNKVNVAKHYYYKFDKENCILHLPVNILFHLEQYLKQNLVEYKIEELKPNEAKMISIERIGEFEDRDYQKNSIDYISKPGMRALELQTGCLVGDAEVMFYRGKRRQLMTIHDAHKAFNNAKVIGYVHWFTFTPDSIQSYDEGKRKIIVNGIEDIVYTGLKKCVRITFEDNSHIECTNDHPFLTEIGWIEAKDLLNQGVISTIADIASGVFYRQAIEIVDIGLKDTYDISCKDPHRNFVANGFVVSNSGKTYIAVRAITELKKRTLVIVPASLMTQWNDALNMMSNTRVGVIRGSKAIYDIVQNKYEVDVDVFLASVNTLQEYAKGSSFYNVVPPLNEFIKNLGIGVKIIDECHINFNANILIDILCGTVEHNIYLSATYIRSSGSSNRIFSRIFPEEIKYDGDKEYSRYVNITEVNYSFGPLDDKYVSSQRGYNQFKYEKYLLKKTDKMRHFINNVLYPTIDKFFVSIKDPGEKLLIIVGMQDFANTLVDWISSEHPQLDTISYLYGTPDEELEKADVIVSTVGSCGTGKDISGLRSMILFSSFSSEPLTLQTIGRLRKMKNTPEFVYLVNRSIDAHKRHAMQKKKIYKFIGKSFSVINT